MQLEQRPPAAQNPALGPVLEQAGVSVRPAVIALLEQAAGDYARTVQFVERASADDRDLEQGAVYAAACAKQGELVALIRANNAGPSHE